MAPQGVQPLRISKNTSSNMPLLGRALAELNPMGVRRNSPSAAIADPTVTKPTLTTRDSSPFDASPPLASPHSFWKSREIASPRRADEENVRPANASVSPTRRASIENLKRASRVTNSSMFAREQDSELEQDVSTISNRPLATHNPNAWSGVVDLRSIPPFRGQKLASAFPDDTPTPRSTSPVRSPSPQKSSLSSNSRYNLAPGLDETVGSEDSPSRPATRASTPHVLRKPKSVTFDHQPPQIKEYESVTPDPSSVASGSREGSCESDSYEVDEEFGGDSDQHEDSFDDSLEDSDKTPVVLPEDWRFMSPEAADTHLADAFDDPFDKPSSSAVQTIGLARSGSVMSNGERRPLPPLPAVGHVQGAAAKASVVTASPPRPASMSKADILGMRTSPMPLEERLRLLSEQNAEVIKPQQKTAAESPETDSNATTDAGVTGESVPEFQPPKKVSRESILRKVISQRFNFDDADLEDSSSVASEVADQSDDIDYANLDPDVPLPSRETSSTYEDDGAGNRIRREGEIERTISMYSRQESRSQSPLDDCVRESSIIRHKLPSEAISEFEDETFLPAQEELEVDVKATGAPTREVVDDSLPNPTVSVPTVVTPRQEISRMSLPEFASVLEKEDLSFGLESYLTPSPPVAEPMSGLESYLTPSPPVAEPTSNLSQVPVPTSLSAENPSAETNGSSVAYVGQLPELPHGLLDAASDAEVSTPDSVIHCPAESEVSPFDYLEVPEPVATIKAPGSKLKTRVSATPADLLQMAATRRVVSGERPPQITEDDGASASTQGPGNHSMASTTPSAMNRRQTLKRLEISGGVSDDLGLGLDEEFDRLLEAKKKGYLMRQNTKLVVANSRHPSDESKTGERSQENPVPSTITDSVAESARAACIMGDRASKSTAHTWTTEPWNGRMRRHSTRRTTIVPEKPTTLSTAPPLPGSDSNVTSTLDSVAESHNLDEEDGTVERGRLFIKVIGIKDLDLPLPKNERCHFQMTLDNGMHCVTTPWAQMSRNAPIGQEFELVVFDDLEFQLTLQTRLERPKSSASSIQSSAPSGNAKKASTFSRLFTSPKKRREQEIRSQEEANRAALQRQHDLEAQQASLRGPSAWDLQNELVGEDGSFARAYVALSDHEQQIYGRAVYVSADAWNEWTLEERYGASTRSKLGGIQRRPPYCIGKIELQMMYVPRPRDATDEDMPKSMSAATRQLKEAEATASRAFEGHLSQQGGDCPYWRRRFFKLNGSKLTAYHDMTRQPRATISLSKAAKLIDDKRSLTKTDPSSPVKSKGRRKSAFAEDEEGYMFVEEGFRIRFANGEVIDFYADDREQKDAWMKVLGEAVGRESPGEKKAWTSMVIDRQRVAGKTLLAAEPKQHTIQEGKLPARVASKPSIDSAPASPRKAVPTSAASHENRPPPIEKDSRHERPLSSPSKTSLIPSPRKLAAPKSPFKTDTSNRASDASKRGSVGDGLGSSPRKQAPESASKRKGVRSMIF